MVGPLKRVLRACLGEYDFYRILTLATPAAGGAQHCECKELDRPSELSTSPFPEIRALGRYDAKEARCFVALDGHTIISACWYWYGDTYKHRNFWPLQPNEAKLVQVTTASAFRGRGIAEALIRFSSAAMFGKGFGPLYARVWHSHAASLRTFEKAGWREVAIVLDIFPLGRKYRLQRRRSG